MRSEIRGRIILAIFLGAVLFCLASPVSDPDFFWHLATGRWIWEHRQLPIQDPFSYTTSIKASEEFFRAKIILTQYWLANLIQYGIYVIGGYAGIIGLRLMIMFLTLSVTYLHLREKELGVITSILLLLPMAYTLALFRGDRPNQMTFLFLAIFLYLLEALRKGRKAGYLLPLVLPIWANMHGGFIIGAVIAFIYSLSGFIRMIVVRKRGEVLHGLGGSGPQVKRLTDETRFASPTKSLLFTTIVTILAGFLNPNGYTVFYSLMKETSDIYKTTITETLTPFAYAEMEGQYLYVYLTMFFLVPAVVLIGYKLYRMRREFLLSMTEEVLLVTLLGSLSFTAMRYIPLLALVVTPILGRLLSGAFNSAIKKISKVMIPEGLIIGLSCWFVISSYQSTVLNGPFISSRFPEEAVRFIKEKLSANGESPVLPKRLFNDYGWGGYLIWSFYPDKVVFIDGRGISQSAYLAYLVVLENNKSTVMEKPAYEAILDAYSVRYILIPAVAVNGYLLPIIPALVDDPRWRLIFFSENSLIFTREKIEPDYAKVLSYGIAIENALRFIQVSPDNPLPYLTVAISSVELGRKEDALAFLKNALSKRKSLAGGPVEKVFKRLSEGRGIL